jgi:hypothetical protein
VLEARLKIADPLTKTAHFLRNRLEVFQAVVCNRQATPLRRSYRQTRLGLFQLAAQYHLPLPKPPKKTSPTRPVMSPHASWSSSSLSWFPHNATARTESLRAVAIYQRPLRHPG